MCCCVNTCYSAHILVSVFGTVTLHIILQSITLPKFNDNFATVTVLFKILYIIKE